MNQPDSELRKLELSENELAFKREELALKRQQETTKTALTTPFSVAAIGGVLTLLTATLGNIIQGCNNTNAHRIQQDAAAKLERQKQQAALILTALDTEGDNTKARENLHFFVEAGLIDDNGKISKLVESAKEGDTQIPSVSPGKATPDTQIRYYFDNLPKVAGVEDSTSLLENALATWQRVARIPALRVYSKDAANVVILASDDPAMYAYSYVGPPTRGTKLEIRFSMEHNWTPKQFQAAACREFGHILGLTNTPTPGQIMSSGLTLDTDLSEPQPEDIERVRMIWNSNSVTQGIPEH